MGGRETFPPDMSPVRLFSRPTFRSFLVLKYDERASDKTNLNKKHLWKNGYVAIWIFRIFKTVECHFPTCSTVEVDLAE